MRSCICSDSLFHFPLSANHFLSYHPVLPPAHQLHLPRGGGQIPCALADEDLGTLAEYDPLTPREVDFVAAKRMVKYLSLWHADGHGVATQATQGDTASGRRF